MLWKRNLPIPHQLIFGYQQLVLTISMGARGRPGDWHVLEKYDSLGSSGLRTPVPRGSAFDPSPKGE